jgi:urea transporter
MLLSPLRSPYHIVNAGTRSFWKAFLHGLAGVLFAIAGLTFWAGGKLISESAKMDRILAEMLGLMIAFLLGALGYILKDLGDDLGSNHDSPSHE